jgi:hypothetical protein
VRRRIAILRNKEACTDGCIKANKTLTFMHVDPRALLHDSTQYCIPKCNPLILLAFWGSRVGRPGQTLTKGVDTHANGSKEEDEEKGETRREEKDDEAPEEEIGNS